MDVKISAAREKDFDIIISLLLDMALLHSRGRPDLFTDGHAKYTKKSCGKLQITRPPRFCRGRCG